MAIHSRTPLTVSEVSALKRQLAAKPTREVAHFYEQAWMLSKLGEGQPSAPPAPTIQQLIAAWRELYRRTPKGRDSKAKLKKRPAEERAGGAFFVRRNHPRLN
jgi:hypothetical protein